MLLCAVSESPGFQTAGLPYQWSKTVSDLRKLGFQPECRHVIPTRNTWSFYFRNGKWNQYAEVERGAFIYVGFERIAEMAGPVWRLNTLPPDGFLPEFEHPDKEYVKANSFVQGPYLGYYDQGLQEIASAESEKDIDADDPFERQELIEKWRSMERSGLLARVLPSAEVTLVDIRTQDREASIKSIVGKYELWPLDQFRIRRGDEVTFHADKANKLVGKDSFAGQIAINNSTLTYGNRSFKLTHAGERFLGLSSGQRLSLFPYKDDSDTWLRISMSAESGWERVAWAKKLLP